MAGELACFHCGQPVTEPGRWLARVDPAAHLQSVVDACIRLF